MGTAAVLTPFTAGQYLGPIADPDQENAQEFWEHHFKNAKGSGFKSTINLDLSQSEIAGIKQGLMEGYKQAAAEGKVREVNSLGLRIDTKKAFDLLNISDQAFQQYEQRVNSTIDDFFAYVGHPEDKKPIHMYKLARDTQFAKSEDEVHCYVAHRQVNFVDAQLIDNRDESFLFGSKMVRPLNLRGSAGIGSKVVVKAQASSLDVKYEYALLFPGVDPIGAYAAPISEILPFSIRKHTAKHSEKALNTWYDEAGRPKVFQGSQIQEVTSFWDSREEGIVEGLIDCFVEDQLDELGFSRSEFEKYKKHGSREAYRFVPQVRAKVKEHGPKWTYEQYKNNPEVLFND